MKQVRFKKIKFSAIFILVCLVFVVVQPAIAGNVGMNINYPSYNLAASENIYYGFMTDSSLGNLMLLESPVGTRKFRVTESGDIHAYRICDKDGASCYDLSVAWPSATDGYIGTGGSHTSSGWLNFSMNQGLDWDPTGDDAKIYAIQTGAESFDLRVYLADDQGSDERLTVYTDYWDGTASDRITHYFAANGSAFHEGALSVGSLSSGGSGYFGGNVGIGTTNTYTNQLHVVGNLGVTGWFGAGCEAACETSGGYVLNYADGHTVGTSYSRYDGGYQVDGRQVISADGYDIDLTRGDYSQIHSVGMISFDWTTGSYDHPDHQGITSKNEAGSFTTSVRINSFNDLINTIDSNNDNGTSYFKVQEHSTGNGIDLFWVESAATDTGDAYHLGNVGIGVGPGINRLDVLGTLRTRLLQFYLPDVNSGHINNHYGIYQETGAWSTPFPDLVINYHTGIKYSANATYDGHRFYAQSSPTPGTEVFSVGKGDNHTRVNYDLYVAGDAGIGTTNPQGYDLYVNGVTYSYSGFKISNGSGSEGALLTGYNGTAYAVNFEASNGVWSRGGNGLVVLNNGGADIDGNVVLYDGNVSIGTTNSGGYKIYARANKSGWAYRFNNDYNASNVHIAHASGYGMHINSGNNSDIADYALGVYAAGAYRLYIRGDGYVGINTTAPTQKLDVVGHALFTGTVDVNIFYNTYTQGVGAICANDSGSLVGCSSDERLKENIETIDNPIEKVKKLRGVYFNWKKDNDEAYAFGGGREIGMIAQEVEKTVPEVVGENQDGYKTMDYPELTSLLIEFNKKQEELINELTKEIEELEKR